MRVIKITHGQEFKYIRDCFGANDVFLPQYKLAASCLEEIVSFNDHAFGKNDDCLNNVIAFTGDRGQGKTSAMLTFTNELMVTSKNRSNFMYCCVNRKKVPNNNQKRLKSSCSPAN